MTNTQFRHYCSHRHIQKSTAQGGAIIIKIEVKHIHIDIFKDKYFSRILEMTPSHVLLVACFSYLSEEN